MEFAPVSRCDIPWCRAPHLPGDKPGHAAQLGLWKLGSATLEVFIGQVDPYPPVVRIARRRGAGPWQVRDLDPELAAELADVLDLLTIHMEREFSAALRQAAAHAELADARLTR
jgi:hypothetical protein